MNTNTVKKEETKAAETTAETTAETGESKAAAGSDKEWIIATDTVFKPFEYTDESGNFVGIDVDILAAIAEDQGFKYELQSLGFDAAAMAVQAGQADAIIAGATIKQERIDSGWIFSEGYYNATQTFTVAADSDIASYEDLSGKNVAVKQGTAGADFANSLKDEYGFTVTVFEDSPSMYQDVILGNSAACVEDTPIMASNKKADSILRFRKVWRAKARRMVLLLWMKMIRNYWICSMPVLPILRQTANTTRSLPSTSADFQAETKRGTFMVPRCLLKGAKAP